MIYILPILALVYAVFCIIIFLGWKSLKDDLVPKSFTPQTQCSIVIPFRNESSVLKPLIKSLSSLDYPDNLLEIILVNDHSEDDGEKRIVENEKIKLLCLSEGEKGKKKALRKGIENAKGELIITSDADCIFHEKWLRTIVYKYEKENAALIAGPVVFKRKQNIFHFFQSLDFIGMQVITAATFELGKPVACNGANLAFRKKDYLRYCLDQNHQEIASGDDVYTLFALQKIYPNKLHFVKNPGAIVKTEAPANWQTFWNQRLRWASKSSKMGHWWISVTLLLIYLFNVALLIALIFGVFDFTLLKVFLFGFSVKFLSEALILNSGVSFFGVKELIRFSPIFQLPHILYTIVIGFFSQFGSYRWKGRKY